MCAYIQKCVYDKYVYIYKYMYMNIYDGHTCHTDAYL